MERLQVRNFGPIESIDIEIKDINIFIGKTSSGKSTVAKLISIFNDFEFIQQSSALFLKKKLIDYNIDFEWKDSTFIGYFNDKVSFVLQGKQLGIKNPIKDILLKYGPAIASYKYDAEGKHHWDLSFLMSLAAAPDIISKEIVDSENFRDIARILRELETLRSEVVQDRNVENIMSKAVEYYKLIALLARETGVYNSIYVPAERILLSMVAESLFGLLKNDVAISTSIKDFGAKFEKARADINKSKIAFLGIEFEYEEGANFIRLPNETRIRLEHTSSGYQSVTPLFLVLEYFFNKKELFNNCIVIEEPESNLYPTAQKDLIEYIIAGKLHSENKLFITTHSPYVLTTIDNLIQAYNVAVREGKFPEEVKKIVPRKFWIDFDKVTCYYFEDGSCRSTMDSETMTIGASNIDDVSIQLGKTFDELISLL